MERRNFIKLASIAGMSVCTPAGVAYANRRLNSRRNVDYAAYEGNFYIFVNAGGGWDPTHLCDPKPATQAMIDAQDPARMSNYLEENIGQQGDIRWAPVGYNDQFFGRFADQLTIINGLDMKTNGHDSGSRHTWSGRLTEGFPSLGALLAANAAPAAPMSYVSFGGYDLTQGIVARARSGNPTALTSLAHPTRRDPDDELSTYHSEAALEFIDEAQKDRSDALLKAQGLPRIRSAMNTLFTARSGSEELKRLQQYLPTQQEQNRVARQAQIAIAAYRAGLSVSANLSIGGFDTHGNHDATQIPALQALLEGVEFIMDEAERQEVADRVVVVVGSDFGRTPGYNANQGKDHWSIGSMMLMGAGIPGGRVIGGTTERHGIMKVPTGNALGTPVDDENKGVRLEPGHVHMAIRKLAGTIDDDLARQFPLVMDDLKLLD